MLKGAQERVVAVAGADAGRGATGAAAGRGACGAAPTGAPTGRGACGAPTGAPAGRGGIFSDEPLTAGLLPPELGGGALSDLISG